MRATRQLSRETLLARNIVRAFGQWVRSTAPKRRKVFVCYRRQDTQDAAGRLYDDLAGRYGKEAVFFDIDSIPLGVNFKTYIETQLHDCVAMLVVIGRQWATLADETATRRLDDPADPVRIEVEAALGQQVPLIPLLVQEAVMPRAGDLPETIRELAFHQGMRLVPEFWHAGLQRLLERLDKVME